MLITLEKQEHGWRVQAGDRWVNSLTPDEALWTIALLLAEKPTLYLRTDQQHQEWEARLEKIRTGESENG